MDGGCQTKERPKREWKMGSMEFHPMRVLRDRDRRPEKDPPRNVPASACPMDKWMPIHAYTFIPEPSAHPTDPPLTERGASRCHLLRPFPTMYFQKRKTRTRSSAFPRLENRVFTSITTLFVTDRKRTKQRKLEKAENSTTKQTQRKPEGWNERPKCSQRTQCIPEEEAETGTS